MERRLAELEARLETSPDDQEALLELVGTLERVGETGAALRRILRAIETTPEPEALLARRDLLFIEEPAPVGEPWLVGKAGGQILDLAFDLDGALLASGHLGGNLRLWSTREEEAGDPRVTLNAHRKATSAVAFSLDGELVTGGGDGRVRLWDLEDARAIHSLKAPSARVLAVAWEGDVLAGAQAARQVFRAGGQAGTTEQTLGYPVLLDPSSGETRAKVIRARVEKALRAELPGVQLPGDHRVAVRGDRLRTVLALVVPDALVLMDARARNPRRREIPGLRGPRGYAVNQAPALGVGPGGAAVLVGSPFEGRGARLLTPGGDLALSPRQVVTAAAVSPLGDLAAFGTKDGEVWLLRLAPDRRRRTEVRARTPEVREETLEGDLQEPTNPPAPRLEGFRFLRSLTPDELGFSPKELRFERDRLVLFGSRNMYALGPDSEVYEPLFHDVAGLDLARGEIYRFDATVLEDGVGYRWIPDTRGGGRWERADELSNPGLPAEPPKAGRVKGKKAVEEQLGVKTRDWVRLGESGLYAFRGVKRPREFWIADPARPEATRNFQVADGILKLQPSPGGTRLAVLGRKGCLELFGVAPG